MQIKKNMILPAKRAVLRAKPAAFTSPTSTTDTVAGGSGMQAAGGAHGSGGSKEEQYNPMEADDGSPSKTAAKKVWQHSTNILDSAQARCCSWLSMCRPNISCVYAEV